MVIEVMDTQETLGTGGVGVYNTERGRNLQKFLTGLAGLVYLQGDHVGHKTQVLNLWPKTGQKCRRNHSKWPKTGQKCPRNQLKWPKTGQKCPRNHSKWPKTGQKCPRNTSKWLKTGQKCPRNPSRWPKTDQNSPQNPQNGPKQLGYAHFVDGRTDPHFSLHTQVKTLEFIVNICSIQPTLFRFISQDNNGVEKKNGKIYLFGK